MTLTPWTHENAFLPGTIVRADAMNLKLDGIAQAIQAICNQINQKIPNLPATFTGETQIPEKTLPNTLLLINSAGAMDLYPKAQFDTDVANAASAAVQAATSATNAQNSASQAQVHEQNAEEHAEAAFNSASAAAASAASAEQAKDDTMAALDTRLGTTGNLGSAALAALIGTVSMSGGLPTGAAFEIGANPNGKFIILADGSCLAWRTGVATVSNPNSADGQIFLSSNQDYSFPVTFVGDVYKSAEVFGPRTEAVWVINPTGSGTSSLWRVRLASSRSIAALNSLLNLFAFGKTL